MPFHSKLSRVVSRLRSSLITVSSVEQRMGFCATADKLAEKKRAEKEVKEALKSEQRAKKEEKAKVPYSLT